MTLDEITFGYNLIEAPLFDKINIEVSSGKWVAFVGLTRLGEVDDGEHRVWSVPAVERTGIVASTDTRAPRCRAP